MFCFNKNNIAKHCYDVKQEKGTSERIHKGNNDMLDRGIDSGKKRKASSRDVIRPAPPGWRR
jgi:hypothetical protein